MGGCLFAAIEDVHFSISNPHTRHHNTMITSVSGHTQRFHSKTTGEIQI